MSFDQSYLDYFHLQQDVFADDAPIPFLNIGGRGDLLENIHQTLVFAELPVLIFAAKGLGKTAIANEILNRFADEFNLILHSIDGFDEVLLNDLPQQIKQEFAQQDDASKTKVVLIDDAHLLTDEQLEQLIQLANDDIRTVFFSEEDLSTVTGDSWYRTSLNELSLRDSFALVSHLFAEGGVAEMPIPPSDFKTIHASSRGYPSKLKRLTREYLQEQNVQQVQDLSDEDEQNSKKLRWIIWGGVLVVVIIVAGAFNFLAQPKAESKSKWIADPAGTIKVTPNTNVAEATKTMTATPETTVTMVPEITKAVAPSTVKIDSDLPLSERLQLAIEMQKQKDAEQLAANTETTKEPEVIAPTMAATMVVTSEPKVEPSKAVMDKPKPTSAASKEVKVVTEKATATATVQPTIEATTAVPAVKVTVTPLSDNGWLAKANNKDYVVQLFGAWDQEGAEKAIKGFKLSKDLQISVTERDGKAWFVVVMGPFKNKAAAQASIADLPKRVTREGPWVRSVASLRK